MAAGKKTGAAKKAAAKKAPAKKVVAKKVVAKKAAAKKSPAKQPVATKLTPAQQAARKKAALSKLAAAVNKARAAGAQRAAPSQALPPLDTSGSLVPAQGACGLGFRFSDTEVVPLEAVIEAGEYVGLLFKVKPVATQPVATGSPGDLLRKLGEFLNAHTDGVIAGGVTTCRFHNP